MRTLPENNRQRGLSNPRILFSLGGFFIVMILAASILTAFVLDHSGNGGQIQSLSIAKPTAATPTHILPSPTAATTSSGFSFTVAGDYGQTSYTTANLNYIAQQYNSHQISFHLALGDFSYDPTVTTATAVAWSSYAKSHLPANFPFEILSGGHDSSAIDTYAADLPNHIGPISGTYAKQYYFDYPASHPLARFIMVTPSEVLSGYSYNKGTPDYNWVASTIDAARAANIHWVIVAMHQYCFVIDSTSCASQDLLDMLLSKHVDLILQAQKHNYQASKQIALSSSCPTLPITSYNPKCVANSSSHLTKGAGSVIVVTGTGGTTPQLAIDTSDQKKGYFRSWMGPNMNESWGLSEFTITATQISMHYVATTGSFSDSFSING